MSFDKYRDEYLEDGCDEDQADELASLDCMIDAHDEDDWMWEEEED